MFKLKPVTNCPHTRKSCGVVYMTPELLAQLSAAVHDTDEWAIVLTGKRKENGYVIDVTDYFVPPQDRSGASVTVKDVDIDSVTGCLPDGRKVVGVIHLHPKGIGVFFSSTDVATLNTRFPMSIVVGPAERAYLGFKYLGVGKVTLPCGATGEIPFEIQPTIGPTIAEVKQVVHNKHDLGDCSRVQAIQPDAFHIQSVSACGLQEPVSKVADAFGVDNTLFEIVKQLPRPAPVVKHKPTENFQLLGKQKGWFESLVPDRFKSSKKEEDDNNGYTDVWCEVCKEYDEFWQWECGSCGHSEYCMACGVGHNVAIGCPKEERVITGA